MVQQRAAFVRMCLEIDMIANGEDGTCGRNTRTHNKDNELSKEQERK
jgi:hypothetical protein